MKNKFLIFSITFLLLVIVLFISTAFGSVSLPVSDVISALLMKTGGINSTIVWDIRIPRVILGAIVGAGLACSGVCFQGMLKNPLADPYTLGISSGAALGVGIISLMNLPYVMSPIGAFAGAFLSVFLIYMFAGKSHFSTTTLILYGIVLGFVFSSIVLFIFAVSKPEKVQSIIIWLMGDLSEADINSIKIVSVIVIICIVILNFFSRELDILTLGDEKAKHLGVDSVVLKKMIFLVSSFMVAACVSTSGIIGFIGLIIPHLSRQIIGVSHRRLLPFSCMAGAILLPLCDLLARTLIAPVELPVGVITGIIGGVFFIIILLTKDKVLGFR